MGVEHLRRALRNGVQDSEMHLRFCCFPELLWNATLAESGEAESLGLFQG